MEGPHVGRGSQERDTLLSAFQAGRRFAERPAELVVDVAAAGDVKLLRLLRDAPEIGADMTLANERGLTPVLAAVTSGELDAVRFLTEGPRAQDGEAHPLNTRARI